MTFTKEQREAVETSGAVPMTIDGIECVILRTDVYEKVCAVLPDELTHEELRKMLARFAQGSDWLDPQMDIYDEYDDSEMDPREMYPSIVKILDAAGSPQDAEDYKL